MISIINTIAVFNFIVRGSLLLDTFSLILVPQLVQNMFPSFIYNRNWRIYKSGVFSSKKLYTQNFVTFLYGSPYIATKL